MRASMVENGVVSCCCRWMQSTNDVIQKIEKTLHNTHTTTQKTPENCHASGQSAQDVTLKNLIVLGVEEIENTPNSTHTTTLRNT